MVVATVAFGMGINKAQLEPKSHKQNDRSPHQGKLYTNKVHAHSAFSSVILSEKTETRGTRPPSFGLVFALAGAGRRALCHSRRLASVPPPLLPRVGPRWPRREASTLLIALPAQRRCPTQCDEAPNAFCILIFLDPKHNVIGKNTSALVHSLARMRWSTTEGYC